MSRLPKSLQEAYAVGEAAASKVQSWANPRLRLICSNENWLFDDRIKSAESWLSKVERGHNPAAPLSDFYGASVIVPTIGDVPRAIEVVQFAFAGAIKSRTLPDPNKFVYDDLHFTANLSTSVSPALISSLISSWPFEIQIHTGIQYAWWRATHEQEYKRPPSSNDWAVSRAAGQARAALELLDGFLSNLDAAASLQSARPESDDGLETINLLRRWRVRARPADTKRFAETLARLLSALSWGYADAQLALDQNEDLITDPNITPIQAIYIACFRIIGSGMGQLLADESFTFVITEEMLSIEPTVSSV